MAATGLSVVRSAGMAMRWRVSLYVAKWSNNESQAKPSLERSAEQPSGWLVGLLGGLRCRRKPADVNDDGRRRPTDRLLVSGWLQRLAALLAQPLDAAAAAARRRPSNCFAPK